MTSDGPIVITGGDGMLAQAFGRQLDRRGLAHERVSRKTWDITDIPQAQMWDEAVLMGEQGGEVITARDVAQLKNSVTYDVLTGWRLRLRRKCVNGEGGASHP